MTFTKVKLDETSINLENVRKRIDFVLQNMSPKQTLLSSSSISHNQTCAYEKNTQTILISIAPLNMIYRDGYDCYAMIDPKSIFLIECDVSRYKDFSIIKCETIKLESEKIIKRIIQSILCLHGNCGRNSIILNGIEIQNN